MTNLGPAPFGYVPESGTLRGAAFSRPYQLLTTFIVLGAAVWLLVLWQQGAFGGDTGLEGLRQAGWFVLGWCLLAWSGVFVWTSQVRLDERGVFQNWVWDKQQDYADMAMAHLFRVRGLEWLIAPRFYVRSLSGKRTVFYVADPALLEECARMAQALRSVRGF